MDLAVVTLNRMAFGPRPGDIDAFNALGADDTSRLAAYVTQQLAPASIADTECDAKIAATGFQTLGKTVQQQWADHVKAQNVDYLQRQRPAIEGRRLKWLKAVYSKRQLFEVMVDFWQNHFNIYPWDQTAIFGTWQQFDRDCIRANALGNFHTMLVAVAHSTAMLYYLDNYVSQSGNPNENYAREMFELHTMGAENYLGTVRPDNFPVLAGVTAGFAQPCPTGYYDWDVFETARALTGWRVSDNEAPNQGSTNDGSFYYREGQHDKGQKIILGQQIYPNAAAEDDGLRALAWLSAHPGTGRYIARKLCRRLIGDFPPQSIVDAAAALFTAQKDANDQIAQVLQLILTSAEFKAAWGEKFKRPFEFAASAVRAVGGNLSFYGLQYGDELSYSSYDAIGQPVYGRRPPDGFPDVKGAWTNTTSVLMRWRFANTLMENDIRANLNANIKYAGEIKVDVIAQTPANLTTANALADFWINRILGRPTAASGTRDEMVRFMRGTFQPTSILPPTDITDRLPRMVALILMCPDFQLK